MTINMELIYGYTELVQVQQRIGSRVRMGGYSIRRDRDGVELSRTPVSWNCDVECWTEQEAQRLAPNTRSGEQ